jgi:hypothetical protein
VTSFIRPEASRYILRNIELIGGAVFSLLGILLAATWTGFFQGLGLMLAVSGAILFVLGLQRARFRNESGGVGVVEVDEGLITYFGPLEGGAVSVQALSRIELEPDAKPLHWVLSEPGQPSLLVPVNAKGADGLFDAFSALPGIDIEKVLAMLKKKPKTRQLVWERPVR